MGESIPWAVQRIRAERPHLTASLPRTEAWQLDAALFGEVLPRAALPGMVATLTHLRPDLVVFESSYLAAPLAAAELGIPAVSQSIWAAGRRARRPDRRRVG